MKVEMKYDFFIKIEKKKILLNSFRYRRGCLAMVLGNCELNQPFFLHIMNYFDLHIA